MKVPAPSFFSAQDLPTATAHEIYITAGYNAVIGWPLANGLLPVGGENLGIVLATREDVEAYRNLCAAQRAAVPDYAAAA